MRSVVAVVTAMTRSEPIRTQVETASLLRELGGPLPSMSGDCPAWGV